ncbi:MAG: RING finger domain-containing protein [Pseudomonadota bacterium]|nr:RING finger domain-containing protein [Pseudomonadota bacterium]
MVLSKVNSHSSQPDLTCAICIDEKPSHIVKACDNNHLFHIDCIKPWAKKHLECPTCREPMNASLTSTHNPFKYINNKVKTANRNHTLRKQARADELAALKTKSEALPEGPVKTQAQKLIKSIDLANKTQRDAKTTLVVTVGVPYINVVTVPSAALSLAVSRNVSHDKQAQLKTLLSAN